MTEEYDKFIKDFLVTLSASEIAAERDEFKVINAQLLAALVAAANHLDFIGYGDTYERSCAHDDGLWQQIHAAIDRAVTL